MGGWAFVQKNAAYSEFHCVNSRAVYSIDYTQHPEIYSARKKRQDLTFRVRLKLIKLVLKDSSNASMLQGLAKGFLYCFVFLCIKIGGLPTKKNSLHWYLKK